MAEQMIFPDTVEEFMEQYKITDTDKVYTNGIELVPIFRMKQWFEHRKPYEEKQTLEIRELKAEIEYLRRHEKQMELEKALAKKDGMIEGLKYSVRCNGISGGEVKE